MISACIATQTDKTPQTRAGIRKTFRYAIAQLVETCKSAGKPGVLVNTDPADDDRLVPFPGLIITDLTVFDNNDARAVRMIFPWAEVVDIDIKQNAILVFLRNGKAVGFFVDAAQEGQPAA